MKRPFAVFAAVTGLSILGFSPTSAQDAADTPGGSSTNADALPGAAAPTSSNDVSDAIAAKQAEIERLKKQLQQANSEIQQLNSQNQKLQTTTTTLKTQIASAPPAAVRPQPAPLTATPGTTAPIDSQDLFWYFHNDPQQANQYLTDKEVRVTGKIVSFEGPVLSRVFGIMLESGDPNLRVVCRFVTPRIYAVVLFHRKTGAIVGRTSSGAEDTLLNMGDVITVEGKCRGNDDGDVAVNSCRLIL